MCDEESFVSSAALGCIKVPSGAGKMELPVNNEAIGVNLSSREPFWRYEPTALLPVLFIGPVRGRHHRHRWPGPDGACDRSGIRRGALDLQDTGADRLVARRRLVIGSGDGHLYMLDLESGENLWEFDIGVPLSAFPRHCQRQGCDRLPGRYPRLLRVSIPRPR